MEMWSCTDERFEVKYWEDGKSGTSLKPDTLPSSMLPHVAYHNIKESCNIDSLLVLSITCQLRQCFATEHEHAADSARSHNTHRKACRHAVRRWEVLKPFDLPFSFP